MDVIERIHTWIREEGSFREGVELYRRAGLTKEAKRWQFTIQKGIVPPGEKEALRTALLGHAGIPGSPEITISRPGRRQKYPGEPIEVAQLRAKAVELRKRYSFLHARLSALPDGEELHQVATQIMEEIIPEEDRIWAAIREYEKTGSVPALATDNGDIVRATVQKMQRVQALRSKVSRAQKKLAGNIEPDRKQQVEKELLAAQVELKAIEEELGINE